MKFASFICPSQSVAVKNIAPLGQIAMTFISGLILPSFHPLEMMDTIVLGHVSLNSLNDVSMKAFSLANRIVCTFSDLYSCNQ